MIEEISLRRSVRKYMDTAVEDEKLLEIIENANLAPSGSNTQPWHFIIVKSTSNRQRLAEASHNQKWMMGAPVFVVCVADISTRIEDSQGLFLDENSPVPELKQIIRDTTIAIDHLVLSAQNLGLGTCWVAWFNQEDIRPLLNIPKDKYVVGIITLGYPNGTPGATPRKNIKEKIHYENW